MKYRERNEVLEDRARLSRARQVFVGLKCVFLDAVVQVVARYFRMIRVGSESWHRVQDGLAWGSSVGLSARLRSAFYISTLPRCGEGLYVHPGVAMYFPQNICVGSNVYLNRGVFITARALVDIEDDVLIGPYTVLNSGNHGYRDASTPIRCQQHEAAPIRIRRGAWIGANATILPGVTVGEGAVVGAGSVVTRDVEPFVVVAGAPAVRIGMRE